MELLRRRKVFSVLEEKDLQTAQMSRVWISRGGCSWCADFSWNCGLGVEKLLRYLAQGLLWSGSAQRKRCSDEVQWNYLI